MNKIYTVTIAAALCTLAVTSSIAGADEKKHEGKFCSALSALNADLARLDALGPARLPRTNSGGVSG